MTGVHRDFVDVVASPDDFGGRILALHPCSIHRTDKPVEIQKSHMVYEILRIDVIVGMGILGLLHDSVLHVADAVLYLPALLVAK